jgi:hypothetical protein
MQADTRHTLRPKPYAPSCARFVRRRGHRQREVAVLNSKVSVRIERKTKNKKFRKRRLGSDFLKASIKAIRKPDPLPPYTYDRKTSPANVTRASKTAMILRVVRVAIEFSVTSMLRQHLARCLARAEAFVIFVFLRDVAALIKVAAFLAADDHRNGAFADCELGMNFVGLHEINFSGADEHVACLPNLGVVQSLGGGWGRCFLAGQTQLP